MNTKFINPLTQSAGRLVTSVKGPNINKLINVNPKPISQIVGQPIYTGGTGLYGVGLPTLTKPPVNEFYDTILKAPRYNSYEQRMLWNPNRPQSNFFQNKKEMERILGPSVIDALRGSRPASMQGMRQKILSSPNSRLYNNRFNTDPTANYLYKDQYDAFKREFMNLADLPNQRYIVTDASKKLSPTDITPDDIYKQPIKHYESEYKNFITPSPEYASGKPNYLQLKNGKTIHALDYENYRDLFDPEGLGIENGFFVGDVGRLNPKYAIAHSLMPENEAMARNIMDRMDAIASYNRYSNMSPEMQAYANAISNMYRRRIPSHLIGIEPNPNIENGDLLIRHFMAPVHQLSRPNRGLGLERLKELKPLFDGNIKVRSATTSSPAYEFDSPIENEPMFTGFSPYSENTIPELFTAKRLSDYRASRWNINPRKKAKNPRYAKALDLIHPEIRDSLRMKYSDFPISQSREFPNMISGARPTTHEVAAHESMHALNPPAVNNAFVDGKFKLDNPTTSAMYNPVSYYGNKSGETLRGISMNKKVVTRELMMRYPEIFEKIPGLKKLSPEEQTQAAEELISLASMDPDVVLNRFNRYGMLPNRQYRYGQATTSPRIPEDYVPFPSETLRSSYGSNRSSQGPIQGTTGESNAEKQLRKLIPKILGITAAVPTSIYAVRNSQY